MAFVTDSLGLDFTGPSHRRQEFGHRMDQWVGAGLTLRCESNVGSDFESEAFLMPEIAREQVATTNLAASQEAVYLIVK